MSDIPADIIFIFDNEPIEIGEEFDSNTPFGTIEIEDFKDILPLTVVPTVQELTPNYISLDLVF